MVATRHDMCEVELVEGPGAPGAGDPVDPPLPDDDADAPPPVGPPRGSRASRAFPASRRRRVAAVAVLLLALTGGELASEARTRSSLAALARVDGVLAPLAAPVAELWRSDPALRPDLLAVAGLLVGVVGRAGRSEVVALDPATGATVWRTSVRSTDPGEDGGGGMRCVVPDPGGAGGAGGPLVVCVADRFSTGGDLFAQAPVADRLVVLDARTGTVLSQRPVPRSAALAQLGSDVVIAYDDVDGFVHVSRTDPLGTGVRWAFVTPRPLPVTHAGWTTRMDVVDDLVVVDEADGWVLDADGRLLDSWAGDAASQLEGSAGVTAGRMLTRPDTNGGPYPRTRVTDLVTEQVFTVRGRPLGALPDDGSLDGSFLVRSGGGNGLSAYDPATGFPQWRASGQVEGRALVMDGRVVRVSSRSLTAVDGRTGATIWQTVLVRPARTSLVTDGRLAVVTQLDGDRGLVLGAYGLDDGRLRWTSDIADDVALLTVIGRQLFGWTGEHLVALSPPG
jgi:outer membrane protein assembly factor BamB